MSVSKSRFLFSLLLLALCSPAAALPDFVRKGYPTCVSCHVSPSGGGILNPYGRGVSESLSTFSYEGQGSFAGIPWTDNIPDPTGLFKTFRFDMQADYRSVRIQPELGEAIDIHMESAIKAALHIGKMTDLVWSGGFYGNDKRVENRTYYAKFRASRHLWMQAGQYLPAFGIMLDDHSAITRGSLGFGQGDESLNAGFHYEDDLFQTTATYVFGREVALNSGNKGVNYSTPDPERFIVRTGVKLSPRLVTGVSVLYDENTQIFGIYSLAAYKEWVYLLSETDLVNRRTDFGSDRSLYYFHRLGSEVFKGLTLGVDFSGEQSEFNTRARLGLFAQFFPTPHVELKFESREESGRKSYLLMSHLWL